MQEMTVEKPKALLKLMGNSLLEWQTYVAREAPISSHRAIGGYQWRLLQKHIDIIAVNPACPGDDVIARI